MSTAVIAGMTAQAAALDQPAADSASAPASQARFPYSADVPSSDDWGSDPDLWLYRDRTVALLRRYLRLSVEVGRLPSLLGREFFRTRVTSYRTSTFEDVVIFVHDVERSLEKLHKFDQELLARMVLQEYSQDETAQLMGCWRRTVGRRYPEAVDELSRIFLKGGLLNPFVAVPPQRAKACQGVKSNEIGVTDWEDAK